jgi:N utilization substance protein B
MVAATRREAREHALSLAYEGEVRSIAARAVLAELPVAPDPYAVRLVTGLTEHLAEIDALLARFSEHWTLERMPVIDRTLLRIGTYELVHEAEIPTAVAISEAVELAKQYSTKDSGRFVNGLLSRIAEEVRPPGPVETGPVEAGPVETGPVGIGPVAPGARSTSP